MLGFVSYLFFFFVLCIYDGNSVRWSRTPAPNINTVIYVYGLLKDVNEQGNLSIVVDHVALSLGSGTIAGRGGGGPDRGDKGSRRRRKFAAAAVDEYRADDVNQRDDTSLPATYSPSKETMASVADDSSNLTTRSGNRRDITNGLGFTYHGISVAPASCSESKATGFCPHPGNFTIPDAAGEDDDGGCHLKIAVKFSKHSKIKFAIFSSRKEYRLHHRYSGQSLNLPISFNISDLSAAGLGYLQHQFTASDKFQFTFTLDLPIEIVNVRVKCEELNSYSVMPQLESGTGTPSQAALVGSTRIYLDGETYENVKLWKREGLKAGDSLDGPWLPSRLTETNDINAVLLLKWIQTL
ncbi:hypothetical protein JB92DRAFT_2832651 [Gautieria morchelliformis]|nr:hypothetical protein JB92DRAFT_2832651 [Gautieria morchelliformis]